MIDSIDSKHSHSSDEFAATLAAPVVAGEKVVFPQGADARVRLVEAQQSGRLSGSAALELELVRLRPEGRAYDVQSGYFNVHGESRSRRTGETVRRGCRFGRAHWRDCRQRKRRGHRCGYRRRYWRRNSGFGSRPANQDSIGDENRFHAEDAHHRLNENPRQILTGGAGPVPLEGLSAG